MNTAHPNSDRLLQTGDEAPDFTLEGNNGRLYSLGDATAVQPVVLVFYRGDW